MFQEFCAVMGMDLGEIPVPDEANTQQYSPAEKELFEKQMDRFIYLLPRDWDCETADEIREYAFLCARYREAIRDFDETEVIKVQISILADRCRARKTREVERLIARDRVAQSPASTTEGYSPHIVHGPRIPDPPREPMPADFVLSPTEAWSPILWTILKG